jgi:predicted DCC family thiol-disulfide oxidoreductase YuxK
MQEKIMTNKITKDEQLGVFYNSACPVCNAGVNHQKRRMKNCYVEWNDVSANNELVDQLDASLEFVRERLHVKNAAGEVFVGIDAFIALWEISPDDSWKAAILKRPVIHGLATAFYNAFAWSLYRWNRMRRHW